MNEEFNVVIAEDEKRICSLIKALIDWDGLHLRLVGEAHDGVQALTLLQQEKVDILITDIRMPGVNGLDLTKWVNDHCNQCSVIIISGYKQFDYLTMHTTHYVWMLSIFSSSLLKKLR